MSEPTIDATLVCNRVTLRRSCPPIAGAMQRTCARCEAAVWVSRASLMTIAEGGRSFEIVCLECGLSDPAFKTAKVLPMSEAQRHELNRELEAHR
jgi:hypothetical protein